MSKDRDIPIRHPAMQRSLMDFLTTYKLDPSLMGPLEKLVEGCLLQMPEVLEPEELQRLAEEAAWEPVELRRTTDSELQPSHAPSDFLPTIEFPQDFSFQDFQPPKTMEFEDPSAPPPVEEFPEARLDPALRQTSEVTLGGPLSDAAHTLDQPVELASSGLLLGSKVIRYQPQKLIAEGGMGQIWRVLDKDLNRVVALKLLRDKYNNEPELLSRFITEAQITSQLEHPCIVPIYEFGRLVDGRFYYTMKEVKGLTLSAAIQEVHAASGSQWKPSKSGWGLWRLLDVFKRICETVGFAHSLHVLHRDLKPDNIIVGDHGEVQILDWGLSKVIASELKQANHDNIPTTNVTEHTRRHQTQPGDIIGTPAYMAPEQMLTPNKVDERSDVYSLGAMLYEILAGVAPFTGKNAEDVLLQMMMGPPPPPGRSENLISPSYWSHTDNPPLHTTENPLLPDGIMEICAKAMHRTTHERFADAKALAHALDHWLEDTRQQKTTWGS